MAEKHRSVNGDNEPTAEIQGMVPGPGPIEESARLKDMVAQGPGVGAQALPSSSCTCDCKLLNLTSPLVSSSTKQVYSQFPAHRVAGGVLQKNAYSVLGPGIPLALAESQPLLLFQQHLKGHDKSDF